MKKFRLLLMAIPVLCVSTGIAAQVVTAKNETEQKVLGFVTAFNQKDVSAMLVLATADVAWMSVSGETISKEASDAGALETAMQDYFSSHPTSFSVIQQLQSSGPWVSTLERADRMIDGQFKGQCAYAMYHLQSGLIQSVWYFSAHPCDG